MYQRIIRDDKVLKTNPVQILNRTQQVGLMQLRNETKHLKGEARWDRMREMANEVYDALTEAVDEVEKDVAFNPREFLGIVL